MDETENPTLAVVFHDQAGRITHSAKLDERSLLASGSTHLEVDEWRPDYDRTHFVQDGALVARPKLNVSASSPTVAADGVSEVILRGVPAGADILVIGPQAAAGTADGSDLHFTFATPGEYMVVARHFPFIDEEVTIHAL